jgi:hypothetical protein
MIQRLSSCVLLGVLCGVAAVAAEDFVPGIEVSVPAHLEDGAEHEVPIQTLVAHGRQLFDAMWTEQEGGGRPLSKGTGGAISDPDDPLLFPRNFNRISAPDANSCAGCHNLPRSGGGGDIVANVFVLGQRFDFATFNADDTQPLKSSHDEHGNTVTLDDIANSRATTSMFGAGYLEMLARQITTDLRQQGSALAPGEQAVLESKGISFGTLQRDVDGTWDTSGVEGLTPMSLASSGPGQMPSLILRPFHQASAVVSLRQFTNNAFNHHHGIQSVERFGDGADPDGDGYVDEMTRADVTAATIYQATLPPPGRVIPRYRPLEEAVLVGEQKFVQIGCGSCHVPALPLTEWGEYFLEPNPFNPPGNLQVGEADILKVNLNSEALPGPRLVKRDGVTWVSTFTDFKLHDISSGPDDVNCETLNMHFPGSSPSFFEGNCRYLTKRLWGAASTPPYFHHGKYTTMRQAILAHAGEAQATTDAFLALTDYEQGSIVEFLKTLRVLPEDAPALVLDEKGAPRSWPPP